MGIERKMPSGSPSPAGSITAEKYLSPDVLSGLPILDVPMKLATNENLKGLGFVVEDPAEFTVEKKTFEIVPWPVKGWRPLDPGTGDEAGTTEGNFEIYWSGDCLYGKNTTIATNANQYLLGYAKDPAQCKTEGPRSVEDPESILLWYSDYHPDGGQLFVPTNGQPFVTCLASGTKGDDIKPSDYTAFYCDGTKGVYIHPGTWHNAVFIHPSNGPATFFNRQGKVHARVSVNWAKEFGTLLRVPLKPTAIAEETTPAKAEAPAILPITVIGSYPKPGYLKLTDWFSTGSDTTCKTDTAREAYEKNLKETDPEEMERQLVKATKEILKDQAELGVDVPTDGEVRRENYVYSFCRSVQGISFEMEDLTEQNIRGVYKCACPTVVGKVGPKEGAAPFVVEEWRKAQVNSCGVPVKITIPGPMTICDTVAVDKALEKGIYKDRKGICEDLVSVIRREVLALVEAGCKHIQLDEPVYARRVEEALEYGIANMDRIFEGVPKSVVRSVHLCCGYPNHMDQVDYPHAPKENYIRLAPALDASAIDWISLEDAHCRNDLKALLPLFKRKTVIFGAIKIHISKVETAEEIQERLEEALKYIDAERLVLAPDCGLGFLPAEILHAKMRNLQTARDRLRQKFGLTQQDGDQQEPAAKCARTN